MANLRVEFKGNDIIKIWSKRYVFECFIVPRNRVSTAIPETKDKMMGVYFLIDSLEGRKDKEGTIIKRRLYIGETSTGMRRFFSHKATKDFWDKIIFFTASKQYFDADTILGLENYLITKYKESGSFNMNQENSEREVSEECVYFGDHIIDIMDFLGYPLEEEALEKQDFNVQEPDREKAVDQANLASVLLKEFDKAVKQLAPDHIESEQMKMYTTYRFENKNLCAVWIRSYGLEVELYTNIKDIKSPDTDAYDISYRKRGKKESAIKIENSQQIKKVVSVVEEMIERF